MKTQQSMAWYNFTTQQTEMRDTTPSEQEMSQYIPQMEAAQGLYRVHIAQGKPPLDAAILVLEAVLGKNQK